MAASKPEGANGCGVLAASADRFDAPTAVGLLIFAGAWLQTKAP
jgi:hypothetical protein